MKKAVLFGVLLLLTLSAVATQCGHNDTNSNNSHKNTDDDAADDDSVIDDDSGDDDQLDDDMLDDDTADDDNSDDDSIGPHPPILTDLHYDPPYAELVLVPEEGYWWASTLYINVCDLGNDLLPDGWLASMSPCGPGMEPAQVGFVDLEPDADGDLSQAGDCANPITIGLLVAFGPESDPYGAGCSEGELCAPFWAGDTAGYVSGQTEVCIMYNPV